jgi:hypothetical protein
LDTVQFIRHGWIERNRILKPQDGWQYISAPLEKFILGTKIQDIKTRANEDWQGKIIRQLDHYKKKSPFYSDTLNVIQESLKSDALSITEINKNILEKTCQYIGFSPKIQVFSEMDLKIDDVTHPGEWALNISKSIGATEYINPTGGIEIFKRNQFEDAGIKLSFMGNNLTPYPQRRQAFENGLSIIDVMMFNSPKDIMEMLEDVFLLEEMNAAN